MCVCVGPLHCDVGRSKCHGPGLARDGERYGAQRIKKEWIELPCGLCCCAYVRFFLPRLQFCTNYAAGSHPPFSTLFLAHSFSCFLLVLLLFRQIDSAPSGGAGCSVCVCVYVYGSAYLWAHFCNNVAVEMMPASSCTMGVFSTWTYWFSTWTYWTTNDNSS